MQFFSPFSKAQSQNFYEQHKKILFTKAILPNFTYRMERFPEKLETNLDRIA